MFLRYMDGIIVGEGVFDIATISGVSHLLT